MLCRYGGSKNHEWFQQSTIESRINKLAVMILNFVLSFRCAWNFMRPNYFGLYQEHNKTQNCTSKTCADKLGKKNYSESRRSQIKEQKFQDSEI